jgi:hypothetical protein
VTSELIAFDDVKICPANSTSPNSQQDLSWRHLGSLNVLNLQPIHADTTWGMKDGCPHDCSRTRAPWIIKEGMAQ